jgi:hypothetical protein
MTFNPIKAMAGESGLSLNAVINTHNMNCGNCDFEKACKSLSTTKSKKI